MRIFIKSPSFKKLALQWAIFLKRNSKFADCKP